MFGFCKRQHAPAHSERGNRRIKTELRYLIGEPHGRPLAVQTWPLHRRRPSHLRSAQAQPAPAPSEPQKQAVQADILNLARIAAGFGCPKPAWAGVNNGVLTIEYVPDNEDLRSWKNIVTVKITPISDGVPRAAAANHYVEKILTVLRAARNIEQLVEEQAVRNRDRC